MHYRCHVVPPKVAVLASVLLLAAPFLHAAALGAAQQEPPSPAVSSPAATADATTSSSPTEAIPEPTPLPARSVVFSVRDDTAVTDRYAVNPARIRAMAERLVPAVAGTSLGDGPARAWRALGVEPKDVVGVKVAAGAGAAAPARRAVVAGIVESLLAAGHPRDKIVVWDRDEDDLRAAGFLGPAANWDLCAVASIAPRDGWDPQATYTAPVMGKLIWGDLLFQGLSPRTLTATNPSAAANEATTEDGGNKKLPFRTAAPSGPADNLSNASHWATILSRRVTKIVNVPTLSDSVHTGIAGALYNVTLPDLDNWRRFAGPPRWGNPTVPALWLEPTLRGKVVLNVCDGLVGQFAGGPLFQPLYAHRQATIYASRDPVALDAVALRYLELWRAQRGLPALDKEAAHVKTAADLGLGHYEAERIDLRAVTP